MNRFKYFPEHLEFLKTGFMSMNVRDLTMAFNKKFKVQKAETAIHSALTNNKIRCGRKGSEKLKKRTKLLTREQEQYLWDTYKDISAAELTNLFNTRFKTSKTIQQIKSFVHNHGINSGRTGHFSKGHKSWNKGTKGLTSTNKTSFKKGQVPPNRKPIGSERIDSKDGFVLIKVAEKNPWTRFLTRYKHKHRHVWEQENGPVPKGMVVAFKDGHRTNCDLENLMLLSRAEMLTLNRHGYKDTPAELKPSVLALSKLQVKIREKEK